MPYARVPTDPAGAPANTVRACVGDQIYRPARFPGDVGGAVHHMRAVVRIPQTMADRSGHLAARSARTWARLRVWNSCPNRCSSRSWRQTPRLPAKSCGPTSMTSPAGTTAGRRRMKRSTLHCARTPAPTWRLRPACSSLPVSVTRSWLRGAPFAAGEGRRSEAALRGSCSPRPWARHPPYGRVGTHRSRARPVSTAPGHPPRPRRIPSAVCGPRLRGSASRAFGWAWLGEHGNYQSSGRPTAPTTSPVCGRCLTPYKDHPMLLIWSSRSTPHTPRTAPPPGVQGQLVCQRC